MMVMRALVLEANLYVVRPDSHPLKEIPAETKMDFAAFVPLQMETLLADETERERLNGFKAMLLGGGPASDSLIAQIQAIKSPVYHTYSMTETYTQAAYRKLNGEDASELYTAMPGVELSTDDRGCLVITSPLTDGEPLVTNDRVELHSNNRFRWLGRWDNVINSGGVKIPLEEVEQMLEPSLKKVLGNRTSITIGVPDEKLGQRLVLVVEDVETNAEKLRAEIAQTWPEAKKYWRPKEVYTLAEIPRTRTGKIDRNKTLELILNLLA